MADDGTGVFSLHSGSAGSVRREASGPEPQHAVWKGMGPCRCPTRPAAPPSPASLCQHQFQCHPFPTRLLLLLTLLCGFAWTAVSASVRTNPHCPLGPCWDQFEKAKSALLPPDGAGSAGGGAGSAGGGASGVPDQEPLCMVLRTYLRCITSTKNSSRGCHGDIGFNSVRSGVRNQLKQYRCNPDGPTLEARQPPTPQPPSQCRYQDRDLRVCGMFGDPHLRTFSSQFQTCKVKGAWPLVNNQHLIVQVTNDPVEGGASDATATSKLTVIVKSHPECGSHHFHTYQAQTDDLPGAFDDGNTSYGPHASLELVEVTPGRHVEIHIRYIATTVIVRQIGRYFTFAVRMPEAIANTSRSGAEPELCTKGCPDHERIDYRQFLARRKATVTRYKSEGGAEEQEVTTVTQKEAEVICKRAGLAGFYLDSCVFDLMATGDSNFTLAALHSLRDVLRLDPAINITSGDSVLDADVESAAAPAVLSRTSSWWWCHVLCALVLVTLWQRDLMAHR